MDKGQSERAKERLSYPSDEQVNAQARKEGSECRSDREDLVALGYNGTPGDESLAME